MKLVEEGSLRILTPEAGYKLYSVATNDYYDIVYLGSCDNIDNYREIAYEEPVDEELAARVTEVERVNNEQDEVINITMMAADEINTEYNAIVDDILLAIDELYNMIDPMLGGDGGE